MILNLRSGYAAHGQITFQCHGQTFTSSLAYREHEAGYHDAMGLQDVPRVPSEAYKKGYVEGLATWGV